VPDGPREPSASQVSALVGMTEKYDRDTRSPPWGNAAIRFTG
jgi:hypothetical protein